MFCLRVTGTVVLIISQRAKLAATYQRIRDPATHGASLQQTKALSLLGHTARATALKRY